MELQRLGKYEIVGKIGQGAMGEVYRAHDPILNRDVAIKTMSAAIGADDELRKRFHREAQSAARLNHPNIITVYDFGEEQGKIYMAMELLEGTDLKDVIGRHTPMSLEHKLGLMEQIAEGLAFAHAKDVVHRDLKPANIHIQPNGQIKIMDFGLAKLASSDMTRAGMIMGTPNYMSPEQVRGEKADSRSDVFSLGAVFYELLANRKPFEADSLHAVLFQVMQSEPEPLMNVIPDIPPLLAQVVEKAMAKDGGVRFRDAGELREALRQVRSQMSTGWSMAPQTAPHMPASDATVIGTYDPRTQAPPGARSGSWPPGSVPPGSVPPSSWPPRPAPASHPPTATPVAARSHPPAPAHHEVEATTLQPPPPRHPGTPVPGRQEVEATTLQPPPPRHAGTPVPGRYEAEATTLQPPMGDVEATTLQAPPPRHPGTPLPVARPVPPPSAVPRVSAQAAMEPVPTEIASRPPTLSGHAPTHVPSTAPMTPARPAPRAAEGVRAAGAKPGLPMPVLAGGGALVLLLAIGSFFIFKGGGGESTTATTLQGGADPKLLEQLVASQVLLAEKNLEDKDFRAAVAQAKEVLTKAPDNAQAKQVLDRAEKALVEIEREVAGTRQAIEGGNIKAASDSLARLMKLDPNNPAIAELSPKLNQYFRAEAEGAKRSMAEAQRAAERNRANSQAAYGAGSALSREADALFTKGQFAGATGKFLEARDAFERARRDAERAARTPSVAPTTTMVAAATPVPTTTLVAVATPEPPPPTTAPAVSGDESLIRGLVQTYAKAIETKDPGLLKTIKPDLSGKESDALKRNPATDVAIRVGMINVQGEKATVMVARSDTLGDGKVFNLQQTLILQKKGGGWTIQRIVSQQIGQ